MAAPAFRQVASASGTDTSGTITVNKPAGTVDNDALIIALFFNRNAGNPETLTITPPAGGGTFSLIRRTNNTAIAAGLGLATYKKICASEGASYAFTLDNAIDYILVAVSYSGVDTTTPQNAENGQLNADGTNIAAPSVTTTVADTRLVYFGGGIRDSNATGAPTLTIPGGGTSRANIVLSASYVWYNGGMISDEAVAATGATGTRTGTISAATTKGDIGHLIALAPTAGAAAALYPPPFKKRMNVLLRM